MRSLPPPSSAAIATCWSPDTTRRTPRRRPRSSRASPRCWSPTPHISRRRRPRTWRRPRSRCLPGSYSHVVVAATNYGKNVAPRIAAKLDVAQVSDVTGIESADTFVRPIYAGNAFATVQSKDPVKVLTVRTTAFDSAADRRQCTRSRTSTAAPDTGLSKVIGAGAHEVGASGACERAHRDLGRTRTGQRRELQDAGSARRQAEGGARRVARGGRRGLRAERLPGGADGQDRGARSLHRDRHLRRDPAPRRHEGQQGDRRHQQGPGSADLPDRRLRARGRPVPDRARVDAGARLEHRRRT